MCSMTINLIDIDGGRRKIASRLAIILVTFVSANSASAEARRIQVGTLTCSLSSSIGRVVGSERNVSCTFRKAVGEPDEPYTGAMTRFVLDVGVTTGGVIV
jgi:hypothetical protein